ncbi:MAG: potassium channel family protein [Candidatus Helarchaeota archaeon]
MSSSNSQNKNNTEKQNLLKCIFSKDALKCIIVAILSVSVAVVISFILGQLTYQILETNASNSGHLYSIIISSITFFFFTRYYSKNKKIDELRTFLILYFVIYFLIVGVILIFLYENISYFFSTLGNSLILFSVFTLLIFLLNPRILGIRGSFKQLFSSGKQVRVILVYLFIVLMQVFGFSLLNYSISWFSWSKGWPAAYNLSSVPGDWFDFIYYSIITFATIGYGDIHPISNAAKFSSIIQAIVSHIISILFLAILFVYISSSLENQNNENSAENNNNK